MAKIYFKVLTKTTDQKKDVSIRIRFKDGKTEQATSTGETVKLLHWDLEKQQLKRTSFKGKDQLVSRLRRLESHVLDQAGEAVQIEKGWLVKVVDKYRHPQKYVQEETQSMFQWIETWISNSPHSYRTIRAYHQILNDLKDYGPEMEWEDLNMDFYDGFTHYLAEKGYAKNTIGARIKNLKVFCNAAYARKVHSSIDYNNFKKPTEDSYNIYLNEKELVTIFELDLTQTPHLDRVRDTFIIGCWTGCRYSDLHKVNEDNIRDGSIYMEQQKTQNRVIVPIHNMVKSILEKYTGTTPSKISNQKFNQYIKDVCQKAELTDKISKGITKGGKRKTETKEKWEMVASHTMRRSFATNLYKSGFPSLSIMAITGHKSEKAFYSYIKVNEEEHAEMLRKHWERQ